MDGNFKVIYKILTAFERTLDADAFDVNGITAESLRVSETRRCKYFQMLAHAGYISGVDFRENIDGSVEISSDNPLITIKGLEYLSENTIMQRMCKASKGIKDIIA